MLMCPLQEMSSKRLRLDGSSQVSVVDTLENYVTRVRIQCTNERERALVWLFKESDPSKLQHGIANSLG